MPRSCQYGRRTALVPNKDLYARLFDLAEKRTRGKGLYAGRDWQQAEYEKRIADARQSLQVLALEPKKIEPGKYRVFIAADALVDVVEFFRGTASRAGNAAGRKRLSCIKRRAGAFCRFLQFDAGFFHRCRTVV